MDAELKQQLDKIEKFLYEHMVTKEEFEDFQKQTIAKFAELTEAINKLTTAVDALAKRVHDLDQEHQVIKHQMSAMQDWIRNAGDRIGLPFKL